MSHTTSGTSMDEVIEMFDTFILSYWCDKGSADPDIILVQCHVEVDVAKELVKTLYGDDPVWQSLTAVKEGRVYYHEKSLFHNKPNSCFADAYTIMADYLYPEK